MPGIQYGTHHPELIDLNEEFRPIDASFMIHHGLGDKLSRIAGFPDSYGQIRVLTRVDVPVAAHRVEHLFGNAILKLLG